MNFYFESLLEPQRERKGPIISDGHRLYLFTRGYYAKINYECYEDIDDNDNYHVHDMRTIKIFSEDVGFTLGYYSDFNPNSEQKNGHLVLLVTGVNL
jgi:hypothetical protein